MQFIYIICKGQGYVLILFWFYGFNRSENSCTCFEVVLCCLFCFITTIGWYSRGCWHRSHVCLTGSWQVQRWVTSEPSLHSNQGWTQVFEDKDPMDQIQLHPSDESLQLNSPFRQLLLPYFSPNQVSWWGFIFICYTF